MELQNIATWLNILPTDPTHLSFGSKGQNLTFSEHCHFAYQIYWNQKYSNMVAIVLPADPPPDLRV